MPEEYTAKLNELPIVPRSGEVGAILPKRLIGTDHESVLAIRLILNRPLFGTCLSGLWSDFFDEMPQGSGILVACNVPSAEIDPSIIVPGDIDILVIPYASEELILSRVMAIEVKAVRGKFHKQGKSPNSFGFRQATALKAAGFPYVAVAHLIVSDESPMPAWRPMHAAKVLDDFGRLSDPAEVSVDWLPVDLADRAYGRLEKNCKDEAIGLLCLYMSLDKATRFFPQTRECKLNPFASNILDGIAGYYDRNASRFLATSRY